MAAGSRQTLSSAISAPVAWTEGEHTGSLCSPTATQHRARGARGPAQLDRTQDPPSVSQKGAGNQSNGRERGTRPHTRCPCRARSREQSPCHCSVFSFHRREHRPAWLGCEEVTGDNTQEALAHTW